MKLKCLIVDDEVLAQDVIERYILSLPSLELLGKCDNAVEAISFLHHQTVDLLFLDLNMPELSGLEMLKTLQNPPKVILTTAYSEYALESYEYGVVDYLLKPIKLERFIRAVNKVIQQFELAKGEQTSPSEELRVIFLKEEQVTHRVDLQHILFVEAYGNYLKVHTDPKVYVIRETLHDMEERLPNADFIQIHKSYLVNLRRIDSFSGNRIYMGEYELPVGDMYKLGLKERLSGKSL